ncbi:hypothetical protein AGMMS49545_01480 [Betaproteobacteria bacterium]|nr:hypothetical protein AGMMS49545_01480 [Betaproteobacteria bacterium]
MKTIQSADKKMLEDVRPDPSLDAAPASDREIAKRCLLARLNQQASSGVRDWRRDDLYEN